MSHQPKVKTKTCEQYLNAKKRISNKQHKLDKVIRLLEAYRAKNLPEINPNNRKVNDRKPIENIRANSIIGRTAEGCKQQDIKHMPRKARF